jgi:hypothetical protein
VIELESEPRAWREDREHLEGGVDDLGSDEVAREDRDAVPSQDAPPVT